MKIRKLIRRHLLPLLLSAALMTGNASGLLQSSVYASPPQPLQRTKTASSGALISHKAKASASHRLKHPDFSLKSVPKYSGNAYAVINDNVPFFSDSDHTTEEFKHYSRLDDLGRCGTAYANICRNLMPTEERGPIGNIRPSGWHTIRYNDLIDGNYLYNRCHLIGYQLAGDNANEKNLITGTRYLNTEGMLSFENRIADYVEYTGNHVLYRVTPVYKGSNLVARGVLMEAYSVEDQGDGIQFNVFCYNVQPGIKIDYATGDSSRRSDGSSGTSDTKQQTKSHKKAAANQAAEQPAPAPGIDYVVNTNTGKFHYPSCSSVRQMKDKNTLYHTGTREELIDRGYDPCKRCNP